MGMQEGAVLNIPTRFEVIECCECHMLFAVPSATRTRWRAQGSDFYCPMGHPMVYRETEIQRLEKRIQKERENKEWYQRRLTDERAAHEHTENRLRATKGVVTRTKKRVGRGVCPCCNRTFTQLQRHMATKHPEYAGNADTAS